MPLSDAERVRVRHHTGYLNVGSAYTFVLGAPASVETTFIIEGAMDRVLEEALPELRRIVQVLDAIEQQKVDDLELLAVTSLGEIEISQKEQSQLTAQYDYWVGSLCNLLGVIRNPWDKRTAAQSRVNATVVQ